VERKRRRRHKLKPKVLEYIEDEPELSGRESCHDEEEDNDDEACCEDLLDMLEDDESHEDSCMDHRRLDNAEIQKEPQYPFHITMALDNSEDGIEPPDIAIASTSHAGDHQGATETAIASTSSASHQDTMPMEMAIASTSSAWNQNAMPDDDMDVSSSFRPSVLSSQSEPASSQPEPDTPWPVS
jgi:hypothetical protein